MAERPPRIYVLAGTNGAGKSSILGEMLAQSGARHFNPDEATRLILARNPGASLAEANAAAWQQGRRLLERAMSERLDFAFETTLGGETFVRLLREAAAAGFEVRIWYVGLETPEIRERWDRGRENLIRLLPVLAELKLLDNTAEGDPDAGRTPRPKLLLHAAGGKIRRMCDLTEVPAWAKPIVAAAWTLQEGR